MILCEKAILVEGGSDELIVQKAYMQFHNGKLPIHNGVDIISVGTSFLRFLEIAETTSSNVIIVTDNDGDIERSIYKKYEKYIKAPMSNIKICFEESVHVGDIADFNYNTLEPNMLRCNSKDLIEKIIGKSFPTEKELLHYMHSNKTSFALSVFDYSGEISFPKYILDAIKE